MRNIWIASVVVMGSLLGAVPCRARQFNVKGQLMFQDGDPIKAEAGATSPRLCKPSRRFLPAW